MPRSVVTPLAAFGVAVAWSGGWIAGKLGVTSAPPLEFSAVRFVIATVTLAAIAIFTRTGIGSSGLVPIVLSAIFGYLGYNALVFVGLSMAPASDAALIVPTTIPVLTAVAASFFGERLSSTKIAGFVLASIGAALVIAAGQNGGDLSGRGIAGLFAYFDPVLALAMAVVFLGDRPQPLQVVGGVVILAGVRVATLRMAEGPPLPEGAA